MPRRTFGDLGRVLGLGRGARLLVVSAHPDDETLGGGRFVADWVLSGGEAYGVTATAGEACFDGVGYHYPSLSDVRAAEWLAALGVLGVSPVRCLGFPDGKLTGRIPSLTTALREIVDDVQPQVIAGTLDGDPHPDHSAVAVAVRQIADEVRIPSIGWPVWLTYFASPPGPRDLQVVGCSPRAERIRDKAWRCFDSQRRSVSDAVTAVVPTEMVELLREQLIVARLPS